MALINFAHVIFTCVITGKTKQHFRAWRSSRPGWCCGPRESEGPDMRYQEFSLGDDVFEKVLIVAT